MDKRKITARDMVKDLRAGADDQTLMKKYKLSAQALQSVFGKLLRAGVITEAELDERIPATERTVDLGLYVCPACGNIQDKGFDECPRCGFVPPSLRKAKEEAEAKKGAKKGKGAARTLAATGGAGAVSAAEGEAGDTLAVTTSEFSRLVSHCRVLGIAALSSYAIAIIAVFAVFSISGPPASLSLVEILLVLIALGLPAVVTSLIVFVILRALAEALKIFAEISGRLMED